MSTVTLKEQSSPKPTRKMWAVIISGAIVGALSTTIELLFPAFNIPPVIDQLEIWVPILVMVAAGYMTREKA